MLSSTGMPTLTPQSMMSRFDPKYDANDWPDVAQVRVEDPHLQRPRGPSGDRAPGR